MKRILLPLLFALAGASCSAPAPSRPNVIVILTDDQGYGDLSAHGNPVLKTPNLDKLHDQSIRLTDFHVAPVCTPTRGELMTGLYALRNKAGMVPAGRNLMRRDIPTMPEIFRSNGYATGLFGKWHLGDTYPHRPIDRGFQRAVWHKGWGLASEVEYDNDYYYTRYLDQLETKFSDRFCANLWFDQAMKWMDEQAGKGQPFFTYLALNTPHSPFDALPEDLALYKDKVDDPRTANFFALIHNIDQNYARLESWLTEKKIRDNTLIVFMNDNGTSKGELVFNAGMRGKKGHAYEGGHRAICFIRWPDGGFGKPRPVNYASHITDILPTFIDLLEFDTPAGTQFDGASLKDVLTKPEQTPKDRKIIVKEGRRIRPEQYDRNCVIWNNWRLIGEAELYDISNDPGQKNNIAALRPEIVKTLKAHYDDYWSSIEDSIDIVEPLVVGSAAAEFTDLTSNSWIEIDCDNRGRVANVCEPLNGGVWQIEAERAAAYKVQLSRWPFHMERRLTVEGPDETIGGTPIDPGKALPIRSAMLSIDGAEAIEVKSDANATAVEFGVRLEKGRHTARGWFRDASGKDLAGAFYGRIQMEEGK